MINTIIIENEKPQSDYLAKHLEKYFPEITLQAVCDNIPEGIDKVNQLHPQLLFLDVELPPYTGFDLLEKTRSVNYEVIFTTSFNKYAIKAIKFCALDFIEKPYGVEDLKEAIERFKNKQHQGTARKIDVLLSNLQVQHKQGTQIGLPVLGGLEFIRVEDIIRCKSSNNYTDIFLTQGKFHTITKTLKYVEDLLKDHQFYRIHDSHLVNLSHIKSYKKGGEGGVVLLNDNTEVDVSRRRKEGFLTTLSDWNMIFKK